jgi:superfamily I DNA/RNA helicase
MVDEFQDVNGLQVKFLDLLLNLTINYFVLEMIGKVFMVLEVQMDYIVNFEMHYKDCEIQIRCEL